MVLIVVEIQHLSFLSFLFVKAFATPSLIFCQRFIVLIASLLASLAAVVLYVETQRRPSVRQSSSYPLVVLQEELLMGHLQYGGSQVEDGDVQKQVSSPFS